MVSRNPSPCMTILSNRPASRSDDPSSLRGPYLASPLARLPFPGARRPGPVSPHAERPVETRAGIISSGRRAPPFFRKPIDYGGLETPGGRRLTRAWKGFRLHVLAICSAVILDAVVLARSLVQGGESVPRGNLACLEGRSGGARPRRLIATSASHSRFR